MIEMLFGQLHFLLIYFGSVVGGSLLSLCLHRNHDYTAYGASGGVCGIIFGYLVMFPSSRMPIFPLPLVVPAWLYAIGFMVASFYAMKSQQDDIGHDAHLGGAIIGLLIAAALHPEIARHNWMLFVTILVISGTLLTYVLVNPLFLPVWAFVSVPSWMESIRIPRWRKRQRNRPQPRKPTRTYAPPEPLQPEPDWLIQEIEEQVGKLERDKVGGYDWIDKFGRTYDVVGGKAQDFTPASFMAAVIDRLNRPGPNFVIVDTRQLHESQVALVRPLIADLPDSQFNRVIRSYGFRSRKRQ